MKTNLEFEVKLRYEGDTLGEVETTEENCKPLTELQVQKMYFLLRESEGFRLGKLDTQVHIDVNEDDYEIRSSPFDVWGGEDNEEGDVWGEETVHSGSMVELDKMNTFENRFEDSGEWMKNPMSVSFEYEVVDGVISDPDEDTHYGCNILSDEETVMIVSKLMSEGYVSDNETGMISVYDDMIVIEVVGKDTIFIPKK
jgi:hypothetical protein